jgi:hypothetical protein
MPLMSLWQSTPTVVGKLAIEQVVATAGDGNLRDGTLCSRELQEYLTQVPSEKLAAYVEQSLSSRLEKGGMILQDLVNELGRRLDYKVTNGRYQGTATAVGFDGIWASPEGHTIIAEVKTTDAYRISLDTIASYRQKLIGDGSVVGNPSILIVVGREDTGELEAQVRGSRHAWDIRLISAEALIKLVKLKENSDEPETGRKIRSVLMPLEYTRLDRLVDVMFTAATDIEPLVTETSPVIDQAGEENEKDRVSSTWEFTDAALLQQKRDQIIASMSKRLETALIKKSRALYWSSDHEQRVACTISKRYDTRAHPSYWYAHHPQWVDFLVEGRTGLLVLGCMDLSVAFAIPRDTIDGLLSELHTTETDRGMYWHIHIMQTGSGDYELLIPRHANLNLFPFQFELSAADPPPALAG